MAAVGCVVVAVLAAARVAQAHVSLVPPFVEADVETIVRFEVPNERRGHVTTSLAVEAPANIAMTVGSVPDGWQATASGRRVSWSGGRITGERTAAFPVSLVARTRPGPVAFVATQSYEDGKRVRWKATLTVLPARGEAAPPQHLRRALTAGAIGLVVIAASLLVLRRLRR